MSGWRSSAGQASILLVGGLLAVVLGGLVLGLVARGGAREAAAQRAADLAALAGAGAMHDAYARLFEPAFADRLASGAAHVDKAAYLQAGRDAAVRAARANGAGDISVSFPDGASFAPVRIRVTVRDRFEAHVGEVRRSARIAATAEATLAPPRDTALGGGGYDGPLAHRQGKPMRPDVAQAFDRMERAAHAAGIGLVIASAFRSDAEQAVLYARHPDPRWVAPPGRSLHRYGTELDLGPPAAYGWLAAHAGEFHFVQRYSWEEWHFGFTLQPTLLAVRRGRPRRRRGAIPAFVPAAYAPALSGAAQRFNVSATLLAAQLYAESNFNPFAVSPAAPRASPSSCPPPRAPSASATRSTPSGPSTPRPA